jgi:redox-sensing transcriptional repressor
MAKQLTISLHLYNRLTSYLNYLKAIPQTESPLNVSATAIADELGLNDVQVRKDLAGVSKGGKPKVGYAAAELISDLEHFLGYDNFTDAAIAGAGNLGKALISYQNFEKYGLRIIAAFDNDPRLLDKTICGRRIFSSERITELCSRLKIRIGIITVPAIAAQEACDKFVAGGVSGIWNFAPVNIKTPSNVAVKNEDMSASLAVLTKQLSEGKTDE